MICPKCHSDLVTVQAITEVRTRHRGCFGWFLWILAAICTCGMILIIPLLTNSRSRSKTRMEAICQNCGHHWRV